MSLSVFALAGFFMLRPASDIITSQVSASEVDLQADDRLRVKAQTQGSATDAMSYATTGDELVVTTVSVQLHMGPDTRYVVIGLLPRNAEVDVIGRDESGRWLAVSFGIVNGWLPADAVSGVRIQSLDVAPVTLIGQ